MILMYCYGTIFHSTKVKVRYKRAVLTSLPFVGVNEDHIDHMAKQVSIVQGDPNQSFWFQMTVTQKISISDPMLVNQNVFEVAVFE